MLSTPDDLQAAYDQWDLLLSRSNWRRYLYPFLDLCVELGPNLEFRDRSAKVRWLADVTDLKRWLQPDSSDPGAGVVQQLMKSMIRMAKEAYIPPLSGSRRPLNFICDDVLRKIAERDYAAIEPAIRGGQTKVVLVLAGSVLEAMLLDVLERDESAARSKAQEICETARRQGKYDGRLHRFDGEVRNWTAAQMMLVAGPNGIGALSPKAEAIARTTKDWRNYVHPDKERREAQNDPLVPPDGPLALALVEKVLYELEQRASASGSPQSTVPDPSNSTTPL